MRTRTGRTAANIDPRDQPAYTLAEAARYLKLAPATFRAWVAGHPYPKAGGVARFQPLIRPSRRQPPILSFWSLIEAHVLRSLRTDQGVSMKSLRQALGYAERSLNIERLLLRKELCTDAGQVFLDRSLYSYKRAWAPMALGDGGG
jgi:helix-turn-helix protein